MNDKSRLAAQRTAFTLLELMAVLTLLAVLTIIALGRYDADALADAEVRIAARQISLDLMLARRESISTGDNHLVAFSAGSPATYQLKRRLADDSLSAASAVRALHPKLSLVISPGDPEFTFEGDALAGATIEVRGPRKTWRVIVQPIAGVVRSNAM